MLYLVSTFLASCAAVVASFIFSFKDVFFLIFVKSLFTVFKSNQECRYRNQYTYYRYYREYPLQSFFGDWKLLLIWICICKYRNGNRNKSAAYRAEKDAQLSRAYFSCQYRTSLTKPSPNTVRQWTYKQYPTKDILLWNIQIYLRRSIQAPL